MTDKPQIKTLYRQRKEEADKKEFIAKLNGDEIDRENASIEERFDYLSEIGFAFRCRLVSRR